jgi:diketogulonate reductase-like aldo/keto reductase
MFSFRSVLVNPHPFPASRCLPAIGLGTFMTFDVEPGGKRDNLFEVTRRYWQAGSRVIDT